MKYVLLVYLSLLCCLRAQIDWETTHLTFDSEIGQKSISGAFAFRNAGTAPVEILSAKSSCGCTVPVITKKVYEAGEEGEIPFEFKFGDRTGKQRKTIRVTYEFGGEKKSEILQFVTTIPKTISISPRLLIWKQGEPVEPKVVKIDIHTDDKSLKIDFTNQLKHFSVVDRTVDEGGSMQLSIQPKSTEKRVQEKLHLKTALSGGHIKSHKIYFHVK